MSPWCVYVYIYIRAQGLQSSSLLVMTYFLLRDYNILPKKGTTFEPLGIHACHYPEKTYNYTHQPEPSPQQQRSLYNTILYSTIFCHIVLCYIMSYYNILHYIILYHKKLFYFEHPHPTDLSRPGDEPRTQEEYGTDGTVGSAVQGHSGAGSLGLGPQVSGVGCRKTRQRPGKE